MAPELMYPDKFGFTSKFRRRLPSRGTDIYGLGMTILEASTIPHTYALKYSTTLLTGHYRMFTFQPHTDHPGCFVQRPRRESTEQTAFGVLGPIVGTIRDYMARRARISALQTPANLRYHRPTEQGSSPVAKINPAATPGTDRYTYHTDERKWGLLTTARSGKQR